MQTLALKNIGFDLKYFCQTSETPCQTMISKYDQFHFYAIFIAFDGQTVAPQIRLRHVVVEVWSKSHDLSIRPHRKILTDRILQISVVVWSKFLKN